MRRERERLLVLTLTDCYRFKVNRMTDRKLFYLFYGAREGKEDIMKQAVDAGADINFPFNGRKGTRGKLTPRIGRVE